MKDKNGNEIERPTLMRFKWGGNFIRFFPPITTCKYMDALEAENKRLADMLAQSTQSESVSKNDEKITPRCENCNYLYGNSAPDDGWPPCEIPAIFEKLNWKLSDVSCSLFEPRHLAQSNNSAELLKVSNSTGLNFTLTEIELIQDALKRQADSWATHTRADWVKPLDALAQKCAMMLSYENADKLNTTPAADTPVNTKPRAEKKGGAK